MWDGIAGDAIGLPGHGAIEVQPTWDANLATMPRTRLVIGYSLGARVALGMLASGRAARAILISVNPGIDDRERAARRASDAAWAHKLRSEGLAAFVDAWSAQPLFASQARAGERLAARRARRLAHDPEQLARSLEVMGLAEMPDYRDVTGQIALIAGAEDTKYVAIGRAMGFPLELVADCGHDPTLEQPTALAAAITRLGW